MCLHASKEDGSRWKFLNPFNFAHTQTDAHYYVLNDIFRSIDAPASAPSTPQAASAPAPAAVRYELRETMSVLIRWCIAWTVGG